MTAVSEIKANKNIKACIAIHNDGLLRGDFTLYRDEINVDEGDILMMFNQYYLTEYTNDLSGSREFLYDHFQRL